MARGKKTGGRDFVPGDKRAGRNPLDKDVKNMLKLDRNELITHLRRINSLPYKELKKMRDIEELPTNLLLLVRGFCKVVEKADWSDINLIFNRIYGNVPLDINNKTEIKQIIIEDADLSDEVEKLQKEIKKLKGRKK
jgi:hypothetical protein